MSANNSEPKAWTGTIQDYLSLGYIYLLVLGIASDSIYYGMLGINILSYSSILDVLLSPVVHLTSSPVFPIVIILMPTLLYFYLKWIDKKIAKSNREGNTKYLSPLLKNYSMQMVWIVFSGWIIFSAFIGFGFGGGAKMKTILESNNFSTPNIITFQNNESVNVRILGNNSGYIFYAEKGSGNVIVAPLPGNVRKIE